MHCPTFSKYFQGKPYNLLITMLKLALEEDGIDLTSKGIFSSTEQIHTQIIAKEQTCVSGLPVIPIIMQLSSLTHNDYVLNILVDEGQEVPINTPIAEIIGPAFTILQTERTILNFISHLSGITTITKKYVNALKGSDIILLDTRKTLPGLRYPDKYAVLCGGGMNHRCNLEELLLIKDNHIDKAGSLTNAVKSLRNTYNPCPPIEVECRNHSEVIEAVECQVNRIMLDNMSIDTLCSSLMVIPKSIQVEVSGGITLNNLKNIVTSQYKPHYVSVGCITNSASAADFSMRVIREKRV